MTVQPALLVFSIILLLSLAYMAVDDIRSLRITNVFNLVFGLLGFAAAILVRDEAPLHVLVEVVLVLTIFWLTSEGFYRHRRKVGTGVAGLKR